MPIKETLNKLFSLLVQRPIEMLAVQIHRELNRHLAVRPEPVEELNQKFLKYILLSLIVIISSGFVIPEVRHQIPVLGATAKDWNPASFWYYPWGRSGVHKGIDIFAKEGTSLVAASSDLVVYSGNIAMGGNVVLILGSQWRFFYYAHLKAIAAKEGQWRDVGDIIGTVGSTGNAVGKPPHLHFSINSLFPLFSQFDPKLPQAWKRMFYIDPNTFLRTTNN